MADGDIIGVVDGHQALVPAADLNIPTVLTGGGDMGHFFRMATDPADTPAYLAILEPGDKWTDTTGTAPFVEKRRNDGNDGWDFASLVAKIGALTATIGIEPDGEVRLTGVLDGSILGLLSLGIDGSASLQSGTNQVTLAADGSITMTKADPTASVAIAADGSIVLTAVDAIVTLDAAGAIHLGNDIVVVNPDFTVVIAAGFGTVTFGGTNLTIAGLPTADPVAAGALWNDTGTVKVSAG